MYYYCSDKRYDRKFSPAYTNLYDSLQILPNQNELVIPKKHFHEYFGYKIRPDITINYETNFTCVFNNNTHLNIMLLFGML